MLSNVLVLLFCLAASVNALSTHHAHRGLAHRAVAHRAAIPRTIRKRADGKRCKVRSSSVAASTTLKPQAAAVSTPKVQPTTTPKAESTTTPQAANTTPKATTTSPKAEPTTTKAEPTTTKAPATTKATTTKAPATTAASNAPSFMVGTQTGQGTFYTTGLGACGITNTDSDAIAAVSHLLFDSFPQWIRWLQPQQQSHVRPKGPGNLYVIFLGPGFMTLTSPLTDGDASVTVTLTDRCEACALTDLDFSPSAFSKLAAFSVGRINNMKWVWL
ncbi:hypothetical protein H0H87_003830 [Tephrocybe sp. NHM501043]|nr:hypothetical protein H0H87_003830 [Tephrocybe sp. NHM501043]